MVFASSAFRCKNRQVLVNGVGIPSDKFFGQYGRRAEQKKADQGPHLQSCGTAIWQTE